MVNLSQGKAREILSHQVNGDSSTQTLVAPIGCQDFLKKNYFILRLNFSQGSSTKEQWLVVCNSNIVHHATKEDFSY